MAFFKKFGEKLKNLFSTRKIDESFFEDLEDTLIEGDLGARLTEEITQALRKKAKEEKATSDDLQVLMKSLLSPYLKTLDPKVASDDLTVFMMLGVNGVGKTTTIAKLSKLYSGRGARVLLAAADTFRAAAVDQLEIHAERLGMRIVRCDNGTERTVAGHAFQPGRTPFRHNPDEVRQSCKGWCPCPDR